MTMNEIGDRGHQNINQHKHTAITRLLTTFVYFTHLQQTTKQYVGNENNLLLDKQSSR